MDWGTKRIISVRLIYSLRILKIASDIGGECKGNIQQQSIAAEILV